MSCISCDAKMNQIKKLAERLEQEMNIHPCKCSCSNTTCFYHLRACNCTTPGCDRVR